MAFKIIPFNTKVKTVIGDIEMIVIGVCIREGWMEYQLSYFVNGEHKTCWINRSEFVICPTKKKAGFVNYETEDIDPTHMIELND